MISSVSSVTNAALCLKLVAVSNSDGTAERGLEAVGLTRFLHGVVDSHEVGVAKPDPAIFDHALALAGCERSRVLHVGDMVFADVVGAMPDSNAASLFS